VLRQRDLPRTELARIFREEVSSVLLGTDSFWTGVDVPGEALTALVIDKLPFPNPTDPLIDAISARDPDAFNSFLVPQAILKLRQGVGRLIRSQHDIGVVVLLDRRLIDKGYGRDFLRSLPRMQSSRDLGAIGRFLTATGAGGAA
jgi:ATP-dependent DNA helicase DinG